MACRLSRWWLVLLVPAVVLAGWGVQSWHARTASTEKKREQARRAMSEHFHSVWRELWDGRVGPGDSVDDVVAATHPLRVERFGRFTLLSYQPPGFDGLNVIGMDGRLVSAGAGSCVWGHTFFDAMSETDRREWAAALTAQDAQAQPGGRQ